MGLVVIPDALIEAYTQQMQQTYYASYCMPALISQATLETYLKNGLYTKHAQEVIVSNRSKLNLLQKYTAKWDPHLAQIIGGHSGYYFSIKLGNQVNVQTLINRLQNRNILVKSNLAAYYNLSLYDNSIRMSISIVTAEEFKEAMELLYGEILCLVSKT